MSAEDRRRSDRCDRWCRDGLEEWWGEQVGLMQKAAQSCSPLADGIRSRQREKAARTIEGGLRVGGNAGRSGRSHVMRSRLNRWVRSNLVFLLVALCGGVVVIVGPWLIPGSPTASQSYAMGFNNRVALVGVLFTIAVLLWIAWRRREDLPEERGPCPRQSGSADPLPQSVHCEMPTSWAALLHALLHGSSGEDHAARKSGSSKPFLQTYVRGREREVARRFSNSRRGHSFT